MTPKFPSFPAKESFTEEPYKSHTEFAEEVFCFMFMEGYVEVEYARDENGALKYSLNYIKNAFFYDLEED